MGMLITLRCFMCIVNRALGAGCLLYAIVLHRFGCCRLNQCHVNVALIDLTSEATCPNNRLSGGTLPH